MKTTKNNIKIIRLGKNDITLAQQLFFLFEKVFNEIEINSSDLPDENYLNNLLAKDSFYIVAAMTENKIIGGLTGYELDKYIKKEKEIYLYDLGVDENYRRQGIATSLINALRDYAKKNDVATIFLEAHEEDTEAIEFYKTLNAEMEEVRHFNISV